MLAKQGYYKSLGKELNTTSVDQLELCPNIAKPIGFILDAAGLDLICCRMHMLGNTNFDKIYKWMLGLFRLYVIFLVFLPFYENWNIIIKI